MRTHKTTLPKLLLHRWAFHYMSLNSIAQIGHDAKIVFGVLEIMVAPWGVMMVSCGYFSAIRVTESGYSNTAMSAVDSGYSNTAMSAVDIYCVTFHCSELRVAVGAAQQLMRQVGDALEDMPVWEAWRMGVGGVHGPDFTLT